MNSGYTVSILGPGSARYKRRFVSLLRRRLKELGDGLTQVVHVLNAKNTVKRAGKYPSVAVYFGGATHSADDEVAIGNLLSASVVIIPVVESIENFPRLVPNSLAGINGMEIAQGRNSLDGVVNLVLENLGLLRKTRRLFISYRRTDSSKEALQLKHELDACGYDVFLDTHSVAKGDDFQEVLWQRLADSDVVILLDTPGFMESRWTKEELAQASAMTLGLVQIIWPDHAPANYTDLCERVYLDKCDFDVDGLTQKMLNIISTSVEKIRARSLAARHNNLVREFCDAAKAVGITATIQPGRTISVTTSSGELISAVPAVGIPDATRYYQASNILRDAAPSRIFLIYDHRGLRPAWGKFLDWLDDFLPVKAVRVTNVGAKLVES